MSPSQERQRERARKIGLPASSTGRRFLGFVAVVVFILSTMFMVFPVVARLVGDVAVMIEPGSAKMGVFFWLIAALAALPAAGFTIFNSRQGWYNVVHKVPDHPSGGPGVREDEIWKVWVDLALIYFAWCWPMFTMGTQYKSVSSVRLADRVGLSIRGSEFLQDTALTAFSVSFTSFFSMYVLHFGYKKLSLRGALMVSVLYLVVELVVFVLVGRSVGDRYW